MINFSQWTPSSSGDSTFGNFLAWVNETFQKIINFINTDPIVFGTYTGDGETSKTINLGFTPKAVVVYNRNGAQAYTTSASWLLNYYGGFAMDGHPCIDTIKDTNDTLIEIVTNGFKVYNVEDDTPSSIGGIRYRSYLNDEEEHYFIAYRNGQIIEVS